MEHIMESGMDKSSRNQGTLSEAASSMNVEQNDNIEWMGAAETYFYWQKLNCV